MLDTRNAHVVVAAIVERDGRFLLVEEHTDEGLRLNQPAGHLEPGESILDATVRETREETGRLFEPHALVGVYLLHGVEQIPTYLRFAFCGSVSELLPGAVLDRDIVQTVWMSIEEIRAAQARHRSPLVMRCVEDYLVGNRYSLALLHEIAR